MKPAFFLRYTKLSSKKNRFRKLTVTLVCAAAVAFTALSTGFLETEIGYAQERAQNAMDRLLIVTNPTDENRSPYVGDYIGHCPMTDEEESALKSLDGVEFFEPLVVFPKVSTFSIDFALPINEEDYDRERADRASISHESMENAKGWTSECNLSTLPPEQIGPEDILCPLFDALSFSSVEYMQQRCIASDPSIKGGGYISSVFAQLLGVTEEELDHLTMEIELMVPVCRRDGFMIKTYDDGSSKRVKYYGDFFSRETIRFEIEGIIGSDPNALNAGYIFLPAEMMLREIEKMASTRQEEAEEYFRLSNYHFAESQGESKMIDWAPNTYYITVKDVREIGRIKNEIAQINPNFAILNEYQDIESGEESLNNIQNSMIYISLAILAVVFLLMALIYVYLIDRRKFEFAVLRANGLTKKEVRKVVCTEMFFQFAAIFLLSLICAVIIYLVAAKALGYPFTFDGMTVVYALLISLGSIVLPTVISLAFANKFETDAVMRN